MKVTVREILAHGRAPESTQGKDSGYRIYTSIILSLDKVLDLLERLDIDEISAAQRGDILYYVNTHLKNAVKKLSYPGNWGIYTR